MTNKNVKQTKSVSRMHGVFSSLQLIILFLHNQLIAGHDKKKPRKCLCLKLFDCVFKSFKNVFLVKA